jgi:hypothetical protein
MKLFNQIKIVVDAVFSEKIAPLDKARRNAANWREAGMLTAKEIIILIIAIFILAALLPGAIQSLNAANTTGFTTTQLALYGVIAVVIIAVVIYKLVE